MSQLLEKIDLMTELAFFNQLNSTQPTQTLITIISLANGGLWAESDKWAKRESDKIIDQEIPVSPDSSKLYKNFSQISWPEDSRDKQSEMVSMVDLTSRITSLTCAILILFQFIFGKTPWEYRNDYYYRGIVGATMLK